MRSLFTKYLLAASNLRTFVTSTNPIMSPALSEWAKRAIADADNEFKDKPVVVDPGSNNNTANLQAIAIAKKFLSNAAPKFLDSPMAEDDDRLVKVGRSVSDLVLLAETDDTNDQLQQGLLHLVEHCEVLASGVKVPKVRFGRTQLQMPIVSLGTMRFQQTWGGQITNMDDVNPKVQENLVAILKHAICNLGISHVEAARGYGSSDFQIGYALKQLFDDGLVKREDLIVQTKVNPMKPADFRATIEKSLKMLQLDYVDLLSVHGLNMPSQYDQVFNNPTDENLIDILHEYKANGKIRHIGFSTHGQAEHIKRCINSDAFDYANIHFHAFGSYTASGGDTEGNKEVVKLMNEKDMGVLIISPNDKGGR
jgi:aryl-alcohol dehydrogenase-like predicted oxidoreductase